VLVTSRSTLFHRVCDELRRDAGKRSQLASLSYSTPTVVTFARLPLKEAGGNAAGVWATGEGVDIKY